MAIRLAERGDELGVRASTARVAATSRSVRIDEGAIERLAERWSANRVAPPRWETAFHPDFSEVERAANYVLVQDAINFCFWGDPPWSVTWRGKRYTGYYALTAALRRALADGVPLLEPSYLAEMTTDQLATLLEGNGTLRLLPLRAAYLREVGKALAERWDGTFLNAVRQADGRVGALVGDLVAACPNFDDRATWRGEEVRLFKRAQLCVADLHGMLGERSPFAPDQLALLTAFADYELPRLLRAEGVLVYADALARHIDALRPLPAGCEEEVAIRACTVQAVERLTDALARRSLHLHPYQVDWLLWNRAVRTPGLRPHHRTETGYY